LRLTVPLTVRLAVRLTVRAQETFSSDSELTDDDDDDDEEGSHWEGMPVTDV
jgi:hypothetical protein